MRRGFLLPQEKRATQTIGGSYQCQAVGKVFPRAQVLCGSVGQFSQKGSYLSRGSDGRDGSEIYEERRIRGAWEPTSCGMVCVHDVIWAPLPPWT